jgi:broad specificity phosphatase PhoE
MSVTTLDLIRHGKTPEKDKKQDQNESLNATGFSQAHRTAVYFKNTPLYKILYSSPYRRADETATVVRNTLHKRGYVVVTDSLLSEISRPLADGKPYSDKTLQKYFDWRKGVIFSPNEENIYQRFMDCGESHMEFLKRVGGQALQAFTHPQFAGQEIAVFTHSQVILAAKIWIEHGPEPTPHQLMDPFWDRNNFPPNCSITKIQFDSESGKWTILESNYTNHL